MKVLLVGSGGREHALAWAIAASPLVSQLWIAPGNAGTAAEGENLPIGADDIAGLVAFAKDREVGLVVVGPEAPLAAGLADAMAGAGVRCFGPTAAAARLEASKVFMKEICDEAGVPTAAWARFSDADAARAHVREMGAPVVVKADGLAAGKGVVVATSIEEAFEAIAAIMVERVHGAAGTEVVIEEFLAGEEVSFFALSDGEHAIPMAAAQDHKRVGEGDTGPNTGGMGACSPPPVWTKALEAEVMARMVRPTLAAMAARGSPFRGVLFAGLILTASGPKLLEYNVRFGDPECQALMLRLESDIVPALLAACEGELGNFTLRWRDEAALVVVMAARGYPGAYAKGSVIAGLDEADAVPGAKVFHAGTALTGGRVVANGGRVLAVGATGASLPAARESAYEAVDRIHWPEGFCRRDIGRRAL